MCEALSESEGVMNMEDRIIQTIGNKGEVSMAVKILETKKESCPAARLIGKKYSCDVNWGEWWENNWFAVLEEMPALSFNGDAYLGAVHIVDGMPERWIGMLFSVDTAVPEGFAYVDIEPLDYAVCYLHDRENSGDFYTMETHNRCLEEIKNQGFTRKENDWCFERYNCPRFTTPDEEGNVILDYAVAVEED